MAELKGTFYGVSVGPGDPELMTLQAVRLIRQCPVLAAPQTASGQMLALDIARSALGEALDGKTIVPLYFAMSRDPAALAASHEKAAAAVRQYLDAGQDVAMLNIGDVSIYATFGYLQEILQAGGYATAMAAGVPSFCAAAARLNVPLTGGMDTPLTIAPGGWTDRVLEMPGTKVLMKAGRQLPVLLDTLQQADKLKIVYTPLHGTGNIPVRRVLKELGFNNVYVVKEQELPDGDFPTVSYPNPEDKNAFTLALKLAAEVDADIVLATDPDADRLGIYAKNEKTGEYESFTGNMSGMLILEYLLSQRKELGMLPENGAVVTTIVSGKMARAIAKEYNVELIETLTGFKYIGEQIKFFEQNHDHEFLFGYEESYGCLEGTHARDKDAVVAVMALCEAAAYYKSKGITLCEQMQNLYQKYGFYKESLFFQTFQGMEGKAKIDGLMDALRNEPPKQVGPFKVTALEDYKKSIRTDIATGETSALTLPESNVLYFELEDGAWFCVRPSGTEPKIKYYAGVKGADAQDATDKLEALSKAVVEL